MKTKTILNLNRTIGVIYIIIYFLYFITSIETSNWSFLVGVILLSPPVFINLATYFYLQKKG